MRRRSALREAGFRVEPFRPSTLEPLAASLWWKFFVQCGAMFYEPEIRGKRAAAQPHLHGVSEHCRSGWPADRHRTAARRGRSWTCCARKTLEEMRDFPVLLCPVASVPAFRPGRAQLGDRRRAGGLSGCCAPNPMVQRAGSACGSGPGGAVCGGIADRRADCRTALRRRSRAGYRSRGGCGLRLPSAAAGGQSLLRLAQRTGSIKALKKPT